VRWVVGIFFLMHGVGHSMGFLASWTAIDVGFSDEPWLLVGDEKVKGPIGRVWGVIWLVALAGWVSVGISVLSGATGWRTQAMSSAVVSLAAILPWWRSVPGGAKAGVLVDIVVLVGLLTPWGQDFVDRLT
jgi:hypothetical protein